MFVKWCVGAVRNELADKVAIDTFRKVEKRYENYLNLDKLAKSKKIIDMRTRIVRKQTKHYLRHMWKRCILVWTLVRIRLIWRKNTIWINTKNHPPREKYPEMREYQDDSVDYCLEECHGLNDLIFSWCNGHHLFPSAPDPSDSSFSFTLTRTRWLPKTDEPWLT